MALVTARELPKPERETVMVQEALAELEVAATIVAWTAAVDWAAYELVVCRTPWDYFPVVDEFCAWARAVGAVTRLENPAKVITWNAHKSYMVELAASGVRVVPTEVVRRNGDGADGSDGIDTLAAFGDDLVVIKPAVSGGAMGAELLPAASPEAAAHLTGLAADGDVLVQPFLPEVAEGETSLVYFDGELSHAVRKVPAAGEYRVQDHHGGAVHPHVATAAERALAEQTLAAVPAATAYARIDLLSDSGGPVLMEAELIEPELFLPYDPPSVHRFARVLADRADRAGRAGR
jgi:glutathione synthase/RimK-type ligase-like ATP-grasp enzyme